MIIYHGANKQNQNLNKAKINLLYMINYRFLNTLYYLPLTYGRYDMVFLILDEEDSYHGTVAELPKETCVSIRFCGSHNEASVYYQKLDDFIVKHKLTITSFSREITMIDYGITNDTSQFVTEIQIPVTTE